MYRALTLIASLLLLVGCGGGSGGDGGLNQPPQSFSVSGEIFLAATAEQDADIQVRGQARAVAQNDDFQSAQQINNPTIVGGYVSYHDGFYTNDEPFFQDRTDIYALPALAGQTIKIRLLNADHNPFLGMNVRVRIYNANNINSAIFTRNIESESQVEYEVLADGDYFIRIEASSFGSGPVIYQVEAAAQLTSGLNLKSVGYKALASDSIVMRFADGGLYRTKASVAGTEGSQNLAKLQSMRSAAYLEPYADIVSAEPEYVVRSASLGVNDSFAAFQWNLEAIGLPSAWAASTGAGTRVAVLDTGVIGTHLDLQQNVAMADGYDFVSDTENGDGNGPDPDATELSDGFFHGTHIAGVIAADTNDNYGIAGIAYSSTIVPVRVLGEDGFGSSFDIAQGIRYAAGYAVEGQNGSLVTISEPVDVINLSLGLDLDSFVIGDAVRDAVAAGVIVIASAGNDATGTPFYPAAYPEVVGVGSHNHENFRSLFSNFGVNVDLLAPGGTDGTSIYYDEEDDHIIGPDKQGFFSIQIGTSFAAPHVSAIAAMMKQIEPNLTPALFQSLLSQGHLTDAGPSSEYYGHGLLNAAKAVAAVGGVLEDQLLAFPETLVFTSNDNRAVLTLSNPGAGQIEITGISFDEAWLSIAGTDVDGDGLGRYAIEMDRALTDGDLESASVRIRYRINGGGLQEETVPVIQYLERTGSLDGVYVYLVSAGENQPASESVPVYAAQLVELEGGQYVFDFADVAEGNYYLEASTDNDGDGQLFDAGEAIGAYRFSNSSSSFSVQSDRGGVNFLVGYENYFEQLNETDLPLRTVSE